MSGGGGGTHRSMRTSRPSSGAMPFSGDRTSIMPNGIIPNGVHSAHTSIVGSLGNHGVGMVSVNRSGKGYE